MIKIHITKDEEIVEKVTKVIKEKHIVNGTLSLIGAVDSCCISTMPKDNPTKDILTEYHEPLELSGTGEITEGKVHIHAVLGREGNVAIAGHLHWGRVKDWFVNVYVAPLN
jgi:uncharacterized protein